MVIIMPNISAVNGRFRWNRNNKIIIHWKIGQVKIRSIRETRSSSQAMVDMQVQRDESSIMDQKDKNINKIDRANWTEQLIPKLWIGDRPKHDVKEEEERRWLQHTILAKNSSQSLADRRRHCCCCCCLRQFLPLLPPSGLLQCRTAFFAADN